MTSFLLRSARIVEVDGAGGPSEPVDVRVEAGVVTAVGTDVADPGIPELDAAGRWADPRPVGPPHPPGAVDRVASARLDLAGDPFRRRGRGAGSAGGSPVGPTGP